MSSRPPRKKAKASKAAVLLRITEVLRIRLDGAAEWDVSEYVREQEQTDGSAWKPRRGEKPLSDRQIRRYIERADALIAASTKESRKRSLVKHLARREAMYAKAMNAGDVRTALAVAQDEAKLRNLYPPKRTELTGKDGRPLEAVVTTVELTDDERAAAVAAILARAAGLGEAGPRPHPDGPGHAA